MTLPPTNEMLADALDRADQFPRRPSYHGPEDARDAYRDRAILAAGLRSLVDELDEVRAELARVRAELQAAGAPF